VKSEISRAFEQPSFVVEETLHYAKDLLLTLER